MQEKIQLSRRGLFGAAAILAYPVLAKASGLASRQAPVAAPPAPRGSFQVLLPHDPAYAAAMKASFPAVHADPLFAQLSPLSCLVVNGHSKSIRAIAARWTVQTAKGTHNEVIFHHSPAWFPAKGKPGSPTSHGVGRRSLVKKGQTVLLTPHMTLTSAAYNRGHRPDLPALTTRSLQRRFHATLATHTNLSQVQVEVKGIYYSDGSVSGSYGGRVHRHMRVLQNAEHDQAVSLLRFVKTYPVSKLARKLNARRYTPLTADATQAKRAYQRARKQHAEYFRLHLQTNGANALLAHLHRVAGYARVPRLKPA